MPNLWELLMHDRELAFIHLGGFISAPPIAALIGIIIGEILFRLKILFRPAVRSEQAMADFKTRWTSDT
jgi:hypothetical protein